MHRTQIFTDAVVAKIKDASINALILLERRDLNAFDAAAQKLKGMLQTVIAAYAVGMISTAQHRQIQFVYRAFRKQVDAVFIQLSQ